NGEFPFKSNSGLNLDAGNYEGLLDMGLELAGYDALRERQERARQAGQAIGVGIAFELTPEGADLPGSFTGGFDASTVRMSPTGGVTVLGGTTTPGSGNDTGLAQIVADELGVELASVTVIQGDTDVCPYGFGNGNGRSTIMDGGSVQLAASDVRDRILAVAARMLDASEDDLDLAEGNVTVRGTARSIPIAKVAHTLHTLAYREGWGVDPALEATRVYKPGNIDHRPDEKGRISPYATFSNAVHVCCVEVDVETGRIEILSHAIADDCGTMINPLAVKGQMCGAAAMGLGGALSEDLPYDGSGRSRSTGFKTYLMPRAGDLPVFDFAHQITPSPFTTLGTKGAGEAGVGGAAAAVTNAVNDALAPLGIVITELPLSPPRVLRAITRAGTAAEGGSHGS
ncbi:MAG: molybdopterin cofactor-binding domain-containing protein, partial [Gaiellaceae bacterium]